MSAWPAPSKPSALVSAALQQHLLQRMNDGASGGIGFRLPSINARPWGGGGGGASSKAKLKAVKPVVDTGLRKPRSEKPKEPDPSAAFATQQLLSRKEKVLDAKRVEKPSLAQRMGLVEYERPQALSEEAWQTLKRRQNVQDAIREPCVICKEDFGLQEQVLLSCSHVFHKACLEAFERFSGRKSCPMCRKEAYEKRLIYDGEYQHLVKCATRIQAAWRGYVARRLCRQLRRLRPPTDPRLRRRFYEERLAEVSDQMVRCCDLGVNDFLADIDRCVAASRRVFQAWPGARRELTEEQWSDTAGRAIRRGDSDCPICLLPLAVPASVVGAAAAASALARPAVLLSCSHVFHAVCIATFEELALGAPARLCPLCREPGYQKRPMDPFILLNS